MGARLGQGTLGALRGEHQEWAQVLPTHLAPAGLREPGQGPPGLPDAVIKFCARRRIGSWCFPSSLFFFFTSLCFFFKG